MLLLLFLLLLMVLIIWGGVTISPLLFIFLAVIAVVAFAFRGYW